MRNKWFQVLNVRKHIVIGDIGVNVVYNIDTSSKTFSSIFLAGKCPLNWDQIVLNLLYDAVCVVVDVFVQLSQRDGETFTYLLSGVK